MKTEKMTIRDIELMLKVHADELDHIQRTVLAMKTQTLHLLEYIEDRPPARGKK